MTRTLILFFSIVSSSWNAIAADNAVREVDLVPSLPGIAEPKRQVVLSVPVDGVLADVLVAEGDQVEPHVILAKLDTRSLEQELRVAKVIANNSAPVLKAMHTLTYAERSLARAQGMRKSSAVSDKAFDDAKTSHEIARSNLEMASNDLHAAQIRCDVIRTAIDVRSICAPFAGRVIKVSAQPGQSLKVQDTVAILANLDDMQVDLYLPVDLISELEIDKKYRLQIQVPRPTAITSTLISIEPAVNAAAGTTRCRFEFDNRMHQIPMGVSMRLITPTDLVTRKMRSDDVTRNSNSLH